MTLSYRFARISVADVRHDRRRLIQFSPDPLSFRTVGAPRAEGEEPAPPQPEFNETAEVESVFEKGSAAQTKQLLGSAHAF